MDLVQEARRSLYATAGAVARALEVARSIPDQLGRAWHNREHWLHSAGVVYADLADRGQALIGGPEKNLRSRAHEVARAARRVPGVAPAEGELTGWRAGEAELPINDYDSLTAAKIVQQLPGLSQRELHEIEGYERRNQRRATILSRIDELRGEEPWPGYDEMAVDKILPRLRASSTAKQAQVAAHERRHKQRRTILNVAHT
jgi:hypothetical protein